MFIKPNGPGGALVMQRDMVFDVYVIVMSGSLYIETFEPNLHNRTVDGKLYLFLFRAAIADCINVDPRSPSLTEAIT